MSEQTTDQLAQLIYESHLLEMNQIDQVLSSLGGRNIPVEQFEKALVQQEYLTNWQLTRLKEGNRRGYFFGNWKLLYLVGAGTFARVYRAVHKKTGDVKAVKVLRNRYADDETARDRFIQEARTVMDLRHPNIVPIHEVELERGRCYMVMDFVEGQNLRDYVRTQGKLKISAALDIARDLASGLDYAMKRGICHRDMKLSNVLLSSRGQAKLVDFGLAAVNAAEDDDADGSFGPRSVDYAGLEKLTNVRRNDQRSDIYFLGCMLYHMIAGAPPLYETRERIKRLSPKRFKEIAPITNYVPQIAHRVVILINRMMDLNPDSRIQNPSQAVIEIDGVINAIRSGDATIYDPALIQQHAEQYAKLMSMQDEGRNHSIMLVETNPKIQDAFREKLKEVGYRVLIMSSPLRAYERFANLDPAESIPADAVIIGCSQLGMAGVEAFNDFSTGQMTKKLPLILMLDSKQSHWESLVDTSAENHAVIHMPLKVKEVREHLRKMLNSPTT